MARREISSITFDLISSLPETISHHILSFLTSRDVKVMSTVCKSWNHITASFPRLDYYDAWYEICSSISNFNNYGDEEEDFGSRDTPFDGLHEDDEDDEDEGSNLLDNLDLSDDQYDCLNRYVKYVSDDINRFRKLNDNVDLRIKRFCIPVTFLPEITTPILDNWISLVEEYDVEEFDLKIRFPSGDYTIWPFYDLPSYVFADKSIKVVNLSACSLLHSFSGDNGIRGSSSNMVKLSLCYVVLDEDILNSIISTCPLIEKLSILCCKGIKSCCISNLKKLRTLQIVSPQCRLLKIEMVDIDAPSLQILKIEGARKLQTLECPKLTHLNLVGTELEDFKLQDFLPRLPFLHSLNLSNLFLLVKVKISSDTLYKLNIVGCSALVGLELDVPNLSSVVYKGNFTPLTSLVHNVTGKWKVSTTYRGMEFINVDDFVFGVRKLVSKLKHVEYLSIDLMGIHPLWFKKVYERVYKPVSNIDHLDLHMYFLGETSIAELLELLFWNCHPNTVCLNFIYPFSNMNKSDLISKLTVSHRRGCFYSKTTELCGCFSSMTTRRWIDCLEDVICVAEDGREHQLPKDKNSMMHGPYRVIKIIFKW